jgi:undecaprenyl-diphosphatase
LESVRRENTELIAGFLAATGALLLFTWLATQVFRNSTMTFDASVRDGVHAWATPALTSFFRVVTLFGSEVILVPLGGIIVWEFVAAGRRHAAILFVIAALGGEALDFTLKIFFRRERPEVFFGYTAPWTYSFPSGHAMLSVCFYGVLAALIAPRLKGYGRRAAVWTAAAVVAVLIGLSRIYLGVHHPSDIAAGYAAGVVWVYSIRAGYGIWLRRRGSVLSQKSAA